MAALSSLLLFLEGSQGKLDPQQWLQWCRYAGLTHGGLSLLMGDPESVRSPRGPQLRAHIPTTSDGHPPGHTSRTQPSFAITENPSEKHSPSVGRDIAGDFAQKQPWKGQPGSFWNQPLLLASKRGGKWLPFVKESS